MRAPPLLSLLFLIAPVCVCVWTQLWDLRTMTEVCQYSGHAFDTVACAFLPPCPGDGGLPHIVTASKDSSIRIWDQTSASCVITHQVLPLPTPRRVCVIVPSYVCVQDASAGSYTSLCVLPCEAPGSAVYLCAVTITASVCVYQVDFKHKRLLCVAATDTTPTPV